MHAPATSTVPAAPSRPDSPDGYLAATAGGLVGGLLLTVLGLAVGFGLMELYSDPNGGLEQLALLIYPIALGCLGLLSGVAVGVRVALGLIGATHATRTAWLTVPFTFVCLLLMSAGGVGLVLVIGVPAVARGMVLR